MSRHKAPPSPAKSGLLQYLLRGGTVKAYALEVGVDKRRVCRWCQDLGIRKQWMTDEEWNHIKTRRRKAGIQCK